MTVFDGSFVTNVGAVAVAGTSGADNRLALTNGASLFCQSMSLGGSDQKPQHSVVSVSEGSRLAVAGDFAFTEGSARDVPGRYLLSSNTLEVAGTGAGVSVGGVMSLGKLRPNDTVNGTVGGSRLVVTDGAAAEIAELQVAVGNCHGQSNRVEFARSAKANIGSTAICGSFSTVSNRRGENEFHVLDGAVVTNAGSFVLGFDNGYNNGTWSTSNFGNRLIVSNATFWTSTFWKNGTVDYMICSSESSIRLSGKDAKFGIGESLSRALFKGWDSSFIVENGANVDLDFLGTWKNAFSYTVATSNETILVRSGATLTANYNLMTGAAAKNGYEYARNNRIVVEDGATLTAKKWFSLYGTGCGLVVDDASVVVGNTFAVGAVVSDGGGTNSYVKIRGSRPYLEVGWSMNVTNDSSLAIALPTKGYDDGYATATKPVVKVGAEDGKLAIAPDSRIELTGAAELLANHKAKKLKKTTYVLVHAKNGISMSDDCLAALQASLPGEGGELALELSEDKKTLSLTVRPKYGLMVIVR